MPFSKLEKVVKEGESDLPLWEVSSSSQPESPPRLRFIVCRHSRSSLDCHSFSSTTSRMYPSTLNNSSGGEGRSKDEYMNVGQKRGRTSTNAEDVEALRFRHFEIHIVEVRLS